jgi:GAF domain-containing protein
VITAGGTADTVMQQGWLPVQDIDESTANGSVTEETRAVLRSIGVRGFCGVLLRADDRPIGLLFVNYQLPRLFGPEDRQTAQTFANHAALALKQAGLRDAQERLLAEIRRASDVALVTARATALQPHSEETLQALTNGALTALDCDAVVLYAYDQVRQRVQYPPKTAGVQFPERTRRMDTVEPDSVVYQMLEQEDPYRVETIERHPLFYGRFARDEEIESCVAVPLRWAGEKVGVMFISYRTQKHFEDDTIAGIELYANQLAVALHNVQQYAASERRRAYLAALHSASTVLTKLSQHSREAVLDEILKQAASCVEAAGGPAVLLGTIQLYDPDTNQLIREIAYPADQLERLITSASSESRLLRLDDSRDTRIGIAGRAALTRKTIRVSDVRGHPDYVMCDLRTTSEIAVPLAGHGSLIGVLNLESDKRDAFDEEDERALGLLAEMAVIALQSAKLIDQLRQANDELEKTQDRLAATSAVAWLGMVRSTWGHQLGTSVATIEALVYLANEDLPEAPESEQVRQWFKYMQEELQDMQQAAMPKPLSEDGEAGAEGGEAGSLLVNGFLRERATSIKDRSTSLPITPDLDLQLPDDASVRVNTGWLREAFSIVINNAIRAMPGTADRRLKIASWLRNDASGDIVCIDVTDSGPGVSPAVQRLLFKKPIRQQQGARGQGVGLLLARVILQTYGGDIEYVPSDGPGATFRFTLPLEGHDVGDDR